MIKEYEELLPLITSKLASIGFNLDDCTDYIATFSNDTSWKISFEGERHVRPLYTIWLEPGDETLGNRFALWLLIKSFERSAGLSESTYTLDQELDWLVLNSDKIFNDPQHFIDDYEKLNAIDS